MQNNFFLAGGISIFNFLDDWYEFSPSLLDTEERGEILAIALTLYADIFPNS